jgi:CRP-like cAMP-binding protein
VNRLIKGLPRKEQHKILEHCETVDINFGDILCEPGQVIQHVHFPLTGFISLVTTLSGHEPLEMGLIGNEGMLGVTLMLDVKTVPMRAVVQGAGTVLRISSPHFQRALLDNPSLRPTLNRYLYTLMAQLAQSAACTHFHEIEPRLARWLLMTHDRSHANHFHLTHDFLANMLGVRRSGITIAAGALQIRNLIHYARGEISVLDRKGLEAASCECYKALINDYKQVLG